MTNILWLDRISDRDLPSTGMGPVLLAGAMQAGLPVPEGFVVTADMFFKHMLENDIRDDLMEGCDIGGLTTAVREERGRLLSDIVTGASIPWDMEMELLNAIKRLKGGAPDGAAPISVSFALTRRRTPMAASELLQLASHPRPRTGHFLEDADQIMDTIKRGWGYFFTQGPTVYRIEQELKHEELGVVALVSRGGDPKCSGKMYSSVPFDGAKRMIVEAVYGLPLELETTLEPDRYLLEPLTRDIVERSISEQSWKYGRGSSGDLARFTIKTEYQRVQKLPDTKVKDLGKLAGMLEDLLGMSVCATWTMENNSFRLPWLEVFDADKITGMVRRHLQATPATTETGEGDLSFFGDMFQATTSAVQPPAPTTSPESMPPSRPMRIIPLPDKPEEAPGFDHWVGGDLDLEPDDLTPTGSPITGTSLYLLINDPDEISRELAERQPTAGVVMLDDRVMTEAYFGTHPLKIIADGEEDRYVELLSSRLYRLCQTLAPFPLLVKSSDWGSPACLALKGAPSQPLRNGSDLGPRGASLYFDAEIAVAFKLELKAILHVLDRGVTNLNVILPFVRTPGEVAAALDIMRDTGLVGRSLGVWGEFASPGPLMELDHMIDLLDGIVVNLDSVLSVTFGVDPASAASRSLAHVLKEAWGSLAFRSFMDTLGKINREEFDVILLGKSSLEDPEALRVVLAGLPTSLAAEPTGAGVVMSQVAHLERARMMERLGRERSEGNG